jgi:flagellar M-ring protein FliF
MLDQVLGPGQAVVRVATEIDYSSTQQTVEKYDPKNSAITTETTTNETTASSTPQSGAGAGVTANASNSSESSSKSNEEKKENTSNTYQVGKTIESHVVGAGSIKRLSVALMLNQRKATGTGADAKPTPRTPEEIKALESIVKEAVGFTSSDTRQDSIETQEVAFADMFADAAPVAPKSTMQAQINTYLPYVTQGCLALLAVGILLYFRSVFLSSGAKSTNAEPDSFETLLNNYSIQTNGLGAANGLTPNRTGANGVTVPNVLTPQELSRLIRENPDNASQALKAWMRRN